MAEWSAPTLEGRIVRLEPLSAEHEEGLWLASRDPRTWRWLSIVQPQTREEWHGLVELALAAAREGSEIPLVTIGYKGVVGSTRYLALRPEHGSVEIGGPGSTRPLGGQVRTSRPSSSSFSTHSTCGVAAASS